MQLKMFWKVEPKPFPKTFGTITYRKYNGTLEDRLNWLNICKNGLVADDADEEKFNNSFYSRPGFTDDDLYFVFDGDKPMATICGICEKESGLGYVHMVSVHSDARGKGLGGYVNDIVQAHLCLDPCKLVYLTTDEWRVPAIKSYLKSGFLPVDHAEDMEERWVKWLTEQGYHNIPLLDEQGNVKKILCAKD